MDISVIVCTYNRSHHLKNVLRSLSEQVIPINLKWEILIVDNNSIDDTPEVYKDFCNYSNIPIRYVKEGKQGLSHARNRGIIESHGKYVAFTDDDAIAESNWVAALYETFQTYTCDCVGGRIYLKSIKEFPSWLTRELWGFLGFLDYGDKPFYIDEKHPPFGGNMAFSKKVFETIGYFNPNYGRIGNKNFGGEENELFFRLLKVGGKAFYQSDAIVHHVIEVCKLKKKYFRRLHYYEGICKGRLYNEDEKRHIYGIPFFIFPQFLRSVGKYIKNPTLRMQMNIWWFMGFIKGSFLEYRKSKSLRSAKQLPR